ncbi:hypothetical protein QTO34_016431 [Cnephaeus nilssonii]|uniref:RNase H type-1 domain-containing protein n=1 Tax=Cnephaeus nilssonii TaxID=3371016 RepID=A0AA40LRW3_CNENI|nr:hypothetical protein QTO34_016431 [Eptesicus nilssonii]
METQCHPPERGLPTAAGKDIKNKEEILALLEVIWLPRAVAIVHCKGHQKGETIAARGNRTADQTAKEAAQKPMGPLQVLVTLPTWTYADPLLHQTRGGIGRTEASHQRTRWSDVSCPVTPGYPLGITKTSELLRGSLDKVIKGIVTRSSVCAQVNAKQGKRVPLRIRAPRKFPRRALGAYPIKTETASIVVKRLLQEIISSFGLPVVIESDNSPAFVAKAQNLDRHEQDSKSTLTKFVLETGENWTNLLPFAILWARLYTQRATHKLVRDALPVPTADPVHPFQPWGLDGCYTVILSMPTAVEVDGTQIWLHHSQLLHQETAWILATAASPHFRPLIEQLPMCSSLGRQLTKAQRPLLTLQNVLRNDERLALMGMPSTLTTRAPAQLTWSRHQAQEQQPKDQGLLVSPGRGQAQGYGKVGSHAVDTELNVQEKALHMKQALAVKEVGEGSEWRGVQAPWGFRKECLSLIPGCSLSQLRRGSSWRDSGDNYTCRWMSHCAENADLPSIHHWTLLDTAQSLPPPPLTPWAPDHSQNSQPLLGRRGCMTLDHFHQDQRQSPWSAHTSSHRELEGI